MSIEEMKEDPIVSNRCRQLVAFVSTTKLDDINMELSAIMGLLAYGITVAYGLPRTTEGITSIQRAIAVAIDGVFKEMN